jgi:hypothetical protein
LSKFVQSSLLPLQFSLKFLSRLSVLVCDLLPLFLPGLLLEAELFNLYLYLRALLYELLLYDFLVLFYLVLIDREYLLDFALAVLKALLPVLQLALLALQLVLLLIDLLGDLLNLFLLRDNGLLVALEFLSD